MAGPTVTNTFANSTTADATQVNQNFTDLINGMTDGSKDLNINALTCAGAATFNGAVTLGNASSDDLTITASLASTLAVKTDNSFDLGAAATALKDIYCYKVYTDALRDRGSSGITCTPVFILSAGLQVNGGTAGAKKIVYASSAVNINNSLLVIADTGALAVGAAVSADANGYEHVFRTGDQGATTTYTHGEIHFSNRGSDTASPTISSCTSDDDDYGLTITCGSHDGNDAADMRFDVRESDNSDFTTMTKKAYVWQRYDTELGAITRSGGYTVGPASGLSNFHTMRNSAPTTVVVTALIKYQATETSNYFLSCLSGTTGSSEAGGLWNNASGDFATYTVSDRRIKTEIVDGNYGLAEILRLRCRVFTKRGVPLCKGFIAQEVINVLPECVGLKESEGYDDFHILDTTPIIPVAVNAIKEVYFMLVDTNKKIEKLEACINK
jgi:hypothetical protein